MAQGLPTRCSQFRVVSGEWVAGRPRVALTGSQCLLSPAPSFQGVVTAATSLITTLAQKNPEEFKTSVSLAVSRLSRVSVDGEWSSVPFGLGYLCS